MKQEMKEEMKSKAQPIEVLAERHRQTMFETTRKRLALRRAFPGKLVRYRRAAVTGPNAEYVLVFLADGQGATIEHWPLARFEQLAAGVSDAEVLAEYARLAEARSTDEGRENGQNDGNADTLKTGKGPIVD